MSERIVLDDIALIEIPYTIGDHDYILREASEGVVAQYRNLISGCYTYGPGGYTTQIRGLAEARSYLVAACLFRQPKEEKALPIAISVDTIKGWKPTVVETLFNKAKEISNIWDADESVEELTRKLELRKAHEAALKNESGSIGKAAE